MCLSSECGPAVPCPAPSSPSRVSIPLLAFLVQKSPLRRQSDAVAIHFVPQQAFLSNQSFTVLVEQPSASKQEKLPSKLVMREREECDSSTDEQKPCHSCDGY